MENLTKRIKSAIIQELIFHTIVILLFVVGIFAYILPTYRDISENIIQLETTNTALNTIKKEGIVFQDFYTEASSQVGSNVYMRTLLSELDDKFYKSNFSNVTNNSFIDFLKEKKTSIEEEKKSESYMERSSVISNILPVYGDIGNTDTLSLSDFSFINNIEELLFSFNLVSTDSIGINDVKLIGSIKGDQTEQNTSKLGTSIYMIPVSLNLTGQKKDILDFLHYLENVGNIKIEGNKLVSYSDSILSQFSENIYTSQFTDIESLIMRKYIDTFPEPSNGDFVNFIKSTQGREKFTIDLSLRFYVAGFPKYKLESQIIDISQKSTKLQAEIMKDVKKYQNSSQDIQNGDIISTMNQLKSLSLLMNPLIKDIQALQVESKQSEENIDVLYKKSMDFAKKLSKIEEYYKRYKALLETTTK